MQVSHPYHELRILVIDRVLQYALYVPGHPECLCRPADLLVFSVLDLGKVVKDAVQKQGMLGWQFNTVGVSDGITMGGEGLPAPATVSLGTSL